MSRPVRFEVPQQQWREDASISCSGNGNASLPLPSSFSLSLTGEAMPPLDTDASAARREGNLLEASWRPGMDATPPPSASYRSLLSVSSAERRGPDEIPEQETVLDANWVVFFECPFPTCIGHSSSSSLFLSFI